MLESFVSILPGFVTVDHTVTALIGAFVPPAYSWIKSELGKMIAGVKEGAAALEALKTQVASDLAKAQAAAAPATPAK